MILDVNTAGAPYRITLARGALGQAGDILPLKRRVLLVTDTGVPPQYARLVAAQCGEAVTVTLPAGEGSKCMEQYTCLLTVLTEHAFTRGDAVVAVGGGVVGDLAAFAASTYLRGIAFYNIPTTVLAAVDSSVGGKTAIDFMGMKNIVGTFYQPQAVLIDPDTWQTLPARQLHAGLAELVKMACTGDSALFARLCDADLRAEVPPALVADGLSIKIAVVEQDPREAGLRRVLNFGHTLGHAIESAAGGALLHGECVAMGMLPLCGDGLRQTLAALLKRLSLPTRYTGDVAALLPYLLHDKKAVADGTGITAVYVPVPGQFEFRQYTAEQLLGLLQHSNRALAEGGF